MGVYRLCFMVSVSQFIKYVHEEAKGHNGKGLSLSQYYLVPCVFVIVTGP